MIKISIRLKVTKNDALVNLFKSHGYEHHGFTTKYDRSSQVRWMGVNYLKGETPASLKSSLIVNVKEI